MFKCPICGSDSYTSVISEMFKCDNCSVLFGDPNKFSKKIGDQEKKKTSKVYIHPSGSNIGGVVSKPIKLNRG